MDLNATSNRRRVDGANSTAGASSCMDDVESLSSNDSEHDDEDDSHNVRRPDDGIYDRYTFDMRRDESLPIHDKRAEIVELIRENPVVVLEGDTGCGKTTQVGKESLLFY